MRRIFFFIVFLYPLAIFSQEKVLPVEINGDEINYLQGQGKVTVKGNVKMTYKDMELTCDEADYDTNSNIAHVKSNVKIKREGTTLYGDDVVYDFNTQNAQMVNIRMESPPIYGRADTADKESKDKYVLKNSYVTTCNLETPHYRLIAKKIIVYPRVKIVAKNVLLKVDGVPVFYFPYYSHSLKDGSFPVQIIPGRSKDWGSYLLTRWRYHINDENRGKVLSDWYEDRGWGRGVVHKMESAKFGSGLATYYFLDDKLYKTEKREGKDGLFDRYPERMNISPKYLEDDRYKAQISYSWQPNPDLSILSEFNKFSDEFFIKDFFYREYEINPQPLSYTLFDYSFYNSSLSLLTQKRANRFFAETEYLPQLEYNIYNQQLGTTNFYLESQTTAGKLTYRGARVDTDYDTIRAYSHDVLSYPKKIKWFYLNPYIGFYGAHYSKDIFKNANVSRFTAETGVDLSTKLYKIFDTDINIFGTKIETMRHLITPGVSYAYIRPPSGASNYNIYQFDSIDYLTRKETITFKLENKLQAKNKEKVWDFIYFSPSAEYQVHQKGKGSYFSTVNTDLEIYPVEGISFNGDSKYDCVDKALKEANADITFKDTKNDKYSFSAGYRYARSENSQSTVRTEYQLTPKFRFKNYIRYEYSTGRFLEQEYSFRTDLHCWWLDIGIDIDKQREDIDDYTFWFAFVLKDFPDIHIGFDHSYSGAKESY
jgi:lipopolysaccharide assembly outer membrane protein LptD (OstA)